MVMADFKGMDFLCKTSKFYLTKYYNIHPIICANEREWMQEYLENVDCSGCWCDC
jgi:hypothetical protein